MEASQAPRTDDDLTPEEARWLEELDAALPGGDDVTATELRLDHYLERIRDERSRIADIQEFTRRRIAMVQEHADREVAVCSNRIRRLEERVRLYAPHTPEEMESRYGKRSVRLPHGEVGFRRSPGAVEVRDERAALEWARTACPLAVRTETKLVKAALKAHATEFGECEGPGWELVDGTDGFFVRTGS